MFRKPDNNRIITVIRYGILLGQERIFSKRLRRLLFVKMFSRGVKVLNSKFLRRNEA